MCYIKVYTGTCSETSCNRTFATTSRFCIDTDKTSAPKTCTKAMVVKLDTSPSGGDRCPFCVHRLASGSDGCDTGCRYRPEQMLDCEQLRDMLVCCKISYVQQLDQGDKKRRKRLELLKCNTGRWFGVGEDDLPGRLDESF